MIHDFYIELEFNRTHSKYYSEVIRLCEEFDEFINVKDSGDVNLLTIHRYEIYAKWDQFNRIFWRTVDWKGSTLGYNGSTFGSHTDKTRIFYAIQDNRLNHLCALAKQIKSVKDNFPGENSLDISANDLMQICN